MTTLLLPLSSFRSVVPPIVLLGVSPHFFATSCALRLAKFVIPQTLYEKLDMYMYDSYQSMVTYFFETFSGTQVIFYGDHIPTDVQENVLYISNHQSSVDWLLVDFIGIRQGSLGRIRYIMKEILKYIPFYGPYFSMHGCIFVRRDGTNQEEQLIRRIRKFEDDRKLGYWLTIFPEGTRYTSTKVDLIEKSESIARKQGYKPFQNVLFPRTKAVELTLETLQNLDAVYDFTIAFKTPWLPAIAKQVGPSPFEMVSIYGREVHMQFKRIPVSQLPKGREQIREWLYKTFKEKDRMLKYFYDEATNGSFPGQSYQIPLKNNQVLPSVLFYTAVMVATLATERGRDIYLKTSLFGLTVLLTTPVLYRVFR